MCSNERLRVLKQRIEEASHKIAFDGYDEVTPLVEELQMLCEHTNKKQYDDKYHVCTCCGKLLEYKRA